MQLTARKQSRLQCSDMETDQNGIIEETEEGTHSGNNNYSHAFTPISKKA